MEMKCVGEVELSLGADVCMGWIDDDFTDA